MANERRSRGEQGATWRLGPLAIGFSVVTVLAIVLAAFNGKLGTESLLKIGGIFGLPAALFILAWYKQRVSFAFAAGAVLLLTALFGEFLS